MQRRNGSARTYGILPLLFARSFPHGGSFTAIPALQVSVGPEHVRILTPAAGLHYGRGPNATWGYLGPIWFKRSISASNDGLAPIYWRFHDLDKDRRTFAIFPLWYSQSQPDRSFHAAFPLVFQHTLEQQK